MSRHESRLRTDRLFPGLALALALALTGCGSDEDAATGSSKVGRAFTSATDSTRLIAAGATAIVPTASSCP